MKGVAVLVDVGPCLLVELVGDLSPSWGERISGRCEKLANDAIEQNVQIGY